MSKAVQELKSITQKIVLGGTPEARQRHTSQNKLLVRDRVNKLLDPKSVAFAWFIRSARDRDVSIVIPL